MNDDEKLGALAILALGLFFSFIAAVYLFKANMEAKAYNKLTGASATTWDALWVELRVQDSPQKK